VMFGAAATVKRALAAHAAHEDVTANPELVKLIGQLDGAGNTAWAVGGIEALTSNPAVPQQVKAQLPGVDWVAISARVSTGVNGELRAEAKDDKAATDLRSVVNGAIAAGHLMSGQNPKLDAFLNSLQVTGTGKDLAVSFTVPPEMLEMATGALAGRRGMAGPRGLGGPRDTRTPAPK